MIFGKRIIFILCVTLSVAALFTACSPKPYAASNKKYKEQVKALNKQLSARPITDIIADSLRQPAYWVGTTNFNLRKPNYVILHHTAQNSCEQTLQTFTKEATQVSAHYVICADGTLHHMLNDYLRAWHAGAGKWGQDADINSASIGIEIDNNGMVPFTEAQLNTLLGVLATLKKTYNIPTGNFIGHADIAPGRKVDPNVYFPWKRLADSGYGKWFGDTTNVLLPADFNSSLALRIIGYDISNLPAATQTFRRHFLQIDSPGELTEPEKKVLYVLMKEYL